MQEPGENVEELPVRVGHRHHVALEIDDGMRWLPVLGRLMLKGVDVAGTKDKHPDPVEVVKLAVCSGVARFREGFRRQIQRPFANGDVEMRNFEHASSFV